MSRWGRPVKNKKRIHPRYFLNENILIKCEEVKEVLDNFLNVGDEMANNAALDLLGRSSGGEPMVHDFEEIEVRLKEIESDVCNEVYEEPGADSDASLIPGELANEPPPRLDPLDPPLAETKKKI